MEYEFLFVDIFKYCTVCSMPECNFVSCIIWFLPLVGPRLVALFSSVSSELDTAPPDSIVVQPNPLCEPYKLLPQGNGLNKLVNYPSTVGFFR